ncbi:MAG: bifunctional proline dehydrogenase/L-glutamate gamma-semialdehyde dehydrogenase PutA [Pseudomonadota bacterium]
MIFEETPPASSRIAVRDMLFAPEAPLVRRLAAAAQHRPEEDERITERARAFVEQARSEAARSGLIEAFLQEYGLATEEGVALMRLAEAMLRTPDAATADALIRDKLSDADWAGHAGGSVSALVNVSTRALMLTAGWLDATDASGGLMDRVKNLSGRIGAPAVRAGVAQAMRILGDQFVLGQTIEAALHRARPHEARGYAYSYDMLGEAAHTEEDAKRYTESYADAIAGIAAAAASDARGDDFRTAPGVSVKLSALHPRYETGQRERVLAELVPRVERLARAARAGGIGLNIDAEEAERLDISLDVIEAVAVAADLKDWPGLGVVVQAYQRRADAVLDWLADLARRRGAPLMVRLVKGAYWDGEIKRAQVLGLETYPVFTRKAHTDVSYLACARKMLSLGDVFYPQFATHNAHTAAAILETAENRNGFEFQRLHGMGETLHDALVAAGARSRIYAPVGGHRDLLPYLVRRLLENGANSSFVNQLFDPETAVSEIIENPVASALAHDGAPNPQIPAPRDHLGDRRSAAGFDLTDPATLKRLSTDFTHETLQSTAAPVISGKTRTGATSPVHNPAFKGETVGYTIETSPEDLNAALGAAKDAATGWAAQPPAARARILRRAADALEADAPAFMAMAVREAGKTWPDALAEVREAVDFLRYYADEAEGSGMAGRRGLGVMACISPWNFPLAIFLGQVAGALAAGNAVIAKPAEQTPLIAAAATRLLHRAGVPADVLHFVPGDGLSVGAPLTADRRIDGVCFTGSTETAMAIARTLGDTGRGAAPLIAETGGINAMIVDSTALLEQAVMDAVESAFQSAGQRCSALRLLCVQEDVADAFCTMLAGAMAKLNLGDPARFSTDVGPLIDADAQDGIAAHIAEMERTARLIARTPAAQQGVDGTFLRPVAFEIENVADLKKEVFGPVLHVVRFPAQELNALLDAINAKGYGLTLGLHTRIDETVLDVAAKARVGNLYVNRNQIGAVVGVQPFGGEGLSGTGPKAGGPNYLLRMSRPEDASEAAGDIALREENAPKALMDAVAAAQLAFRERPPSQTASTVLPGPTGERNTLSEAPRGVILCLGGPSPDDFTKQVDKARAAGNVVIAFAPQSALKHLMHTDDRYVTSVDYGDVLPLGALDVQGIDGVALDGGAQTRNAVAARLARRDGPLIPLLSSRDGPYRFSVERTLTINTTAAGGDVALLSLDA